MRLVTRHPQPLGLEEGSVVGRYRVLGAPVRHRERELICDAVGPDGEPVSLVMALSPPPGPQGWARFRRCARQRARLHHRALLPVRAVGVHASRPYVATDAYPAETFADLLKRSTLPAEEVLTLLVPVCDALDFAHASGLVHQSLSSRSVLVADRGTLMLDAFGVAGGPHYKTAAPTDAYDVRYSAPEELYGERLSPASNVYSVACLLVEALTAGPRPRGRRMPARGYLHLMEPSEALSGRGLGLGAALDDVFRRGMALRREHRPASCRQLLNQAAAALGVSLPQTAGDSRAELGSLPRRRAAPRRRIASALPVATAVAAVVAGVAAGALVDPFGGTSNSAARPSADARALARLDDRRTLLRGRLSAGDTPQEQAVAASELADAYGRAARAAESPALVSAAQEAQRAYDDLAAASDVGSADNFAAASDEVARAESRIAAAAGGRR
jgi:hypothetical protein